MRLLPFLQDPPALAKYEGFKVLLLRTFGVSRRDRATRLPHMNRLGDRKPSVLMAKMFALMDGHCLCLLFQQAFLEQRPDNVRLMLTGADFADPIQLAERPTNSGW